MKDIKHKGIRPCGHHLEDGIVQVCFTLPLTCNEQAQKAALAYARRMGLVDAHVTWMEGIGADFTYFILYGKSQYTLDPAELRSRTGDIRPVAEKVSELDREYRERLGRRAILLACMDGTEENEIGFEALVSLKGVSGEIGLEGYSTFVLRRAQGFDSVDAIVEAAVNTKADALIVCEPNRGWGSGEKALKELARKLKKSKDLPGWFVLSCWRGDPGRAGTAVSGYDLSFGRGVQPSRIADQIVHTLDRKGFNDEIKRQKESLEPKKKRRLLGLFGRKE